MMYNHYNSDSERFGEIDHIDSSLEYPDIISNLQELTEKDHMEKCSIELSNSNPMNKVNKEYISKVRSALMAGKSNHRFSGVDNYQMIELVKNKFNTGNYESVLHAYRAVREEDGIPLPVTFSNYRFGRIFNKRDLPKIERYKG